MPTARIVLTMGHRMTLMTTHRVFPTAGCRVVLKATTYRVFPMASYRQTAMTTSRRTFPMADYRVPRVTAHRVVRVPVDCSTLTAPRQALRVPDVHAFRAARRLSRRVPADRVCRAATRRPVPSSAHRATRSGAHPAADRTTMTRTGMLQAALAPPLSSIPGSAGRRSPGRSPMAPRGTTPDRIPPGSTPPRPSTAQLRTGARAIASGTSTSRWTARTTAGAPAL